MVNFFFLPNYWVKNRAFICTHVLLLPDCDVMEQESESGSASKPTYLATTAQPAQSTIAQILQGCKSVQQVKAVNLHGLTSAEAKPI